MGENSFTIQAILDIDDKSIDNLEQDLKGLQNVARNTFKNVDITAPLEQQFKSLKASFAAFLGNLPNGINGQKIAAAITGAISDAFKDIYPEAEEAAGKLNSILFEVLSKQHFDFSEVLGLEEVNKLADTVFNRLTAGISQFNTTVTRAADGVKQLTDAEIANAKASQSAFNDKQIEKYYNTTKSAKEASEVFNEEFNRTTTFAEETNNSLNNLMATMKQLADKRDTNKRLFDDVYGKAPSKEVLAGADELIKYIEKEEEELKKAKKAQDDYNSAKIDNQAQEQWKKENFSGESAKEAADVFIQAEKEKEQAAEQTAQEIKNKYQDAVNTIKNSSDAAKAEFKADVDAAANSTIRNITQEEKAAKEASKAAEASARNHALQWAKVGTGVYTLIRAFKSLEQAVKKAFTIIANGTKIAIKAFATLTTSVTKMAVTLSGLPIVFKGIFGAVSGIANSIKSTVSGISFTNLLKESSELASSLHETQNRVEQVFGTEGANLINKFSETAVSSLGMATLTARDFAASFGAALRSTGQSVDNIQQMSIGLTKLSADLASFYDIEQDVAKEKLFSGVISGQVKAMRQLGVDMTVASLKAYALQEGYSKLYTEMTAAEKQAVRYRYAMDKLNYVHGDYQRTITSTANQLRLLKNQFKELGTIIGSIINKFIQPLLIWLNAVASKVLEVAKTIASVMGIDWTLGAGSGSAALPEVTDEYDDMAESAEAVADAEGNATDNLHKLSKAAKNALAPFHKLNVLQNKTAKDAEKSGDIGVITPGETSGVFDMKKALGDFFDWLWSLDWEGAVKKFADAINEFFKGLPEKVQDFFDKLQPWIQRIVECFNLLVSEIDWHTIGSTISEVIEGIGRSIGTAADTLNAANLGKAFADLVNGLIDNKDMFTEWGHAVGSSIDNAFEFVANAAKEIHWSTLGNNLFEGLKEGLKQLTPANIHDAIYNSLSGISTTITNFFESLNNDEDTKTKIGECIHAAITGAGDYIKNGGWHDLLQSISTFITNALKGLKEELDDPENQKAVATAITELIEAAKPVAAELKNIAKSIYENYLKPAVEQFLKDPEIPLSVKLLVGWEIVEKTGLGDLLKSIIQTAFAGAMIKGAIKKGLAGVGKEVAAGAGSGGGAAEVSLLTKALTGLKGVFSALGPYIAAVLAILAEFFAGEYGVQKLLGYDIEGSTFAEKWKSFWGNFAEITTNAWNNTKTLFTDIIPGVFEGLGVVVGTALGKLIVVVSSWFNDVKTWFVDGFNSLASSVGEFFAPVGEAFKTAFNFLTGVALTVWEDIKAVFTGAAEWFRSTVWQPIVDLASPIIQSIATFFNELWTNIQSVWSSVSEWFVNLWNTISTTAQEILAGIGTFFNELWVNIQTVWGEVTEWFQTTIWQPITDAVMKLKEDISTFFTELWESIKETWGSVVEWFQTTVWQPLTDAADTIKKTIEESFGDAVDYVQEKWQGFVDFFEGIYNTVKDWLTDLIDMAKEWASSMVSKGESFWSGGSSSYSVRGYANGGVFLPNKPQLALLGDNKSQTEYALTTGHLQQIASMMAGAIGSGNGGVGDITIPIYLGDELLDTRVVTAGQMHSYRSNGR